MRRGRAGHRLVGAEAFADAGEDLAADLDALRLVRRRRGQRALMGRRLDRSAQLCVEAFDRGVVDGFAIATELVGALADGIDQTLDGRHEVLEASRDLDDDGAGGRSCRFASPRILDCHPSSDRERRFHVQVTYLQHVA